MTDTTTADQHAARAANLAAKADAVYRQLADATEKNGGVPPQIHAAFLAEMTALAALAQVHATLATRPGPEVAA